MHGTGSVPSPHTHATASTISVAAIEKWLPSAIAPTPAASPRHRLVPPLIRLLPVTPPVRIGTCPYNSNRSIPPRPLTRHVRQYHRPQSSHDQVRSARQRLAVRLWLADLQGRLSVHRTPSGPYRGLEPSLLAGFA